jgi:hypothetical protein
VLDITGISSDFRFELVSYWVGFFVAGYVLKDVLLSKRWAMLALVAWLGLSSVSPLNAYLQNVYAGSSVSFFFVFMAKYVFSIVSHQATLSLIAFFALRSLGDLPSFSSSRFGRLVINIAPLTFGIYLCHHLFLVPSMQILDKILGLGSCKSGLIVFCAVPTLVAVFYFAAAVLIYLIRRSRYLKFLAP